LSRDVGQDGRVCTVRGSRSSDFNTVLHGRELLHTSHTVRRRRAAAEGQFERSGVARAEQSGAAGISVPSGNLEKALDEDHRTSPAAFGRCVGAVANLNCSAASRVFFIAGSGEWERGRQALAPYHPPFLPACLSASIHPSLHPSLHLVSIVGRVVGERSGNLKDTGSLEHRLPEN